MTEEDSERQIKKLLKTLREDPIGFVDGIRAALSEMVAAIALGGEDRTRADQLAQCRNAVWNDLLAARDKFNVIDPDYHAAAWNNLRGQIAALESLYKQFGG